MPRMRDAAVSATAWLVFMVGAPAEVSADGKYFYAKSSSGAVDTYWRCGATDACFPVNATDTVRLADLDTEGIEAENMEYGDGGGIGWAVGTDRAYFAADGVISDNLSSDLVVREFKFLGDQIHLLGVETATNEGGLFSVEFDSASRTFSFQKIDTFGLDVVELVEVDVPD